MLFGHIEQQLNLLVYRRRIYILLAIISAGIHNIIKHKLRFSPLTTSIFLQPAIDLLAAEPD